MARKGLTAFISLFVIVATEIRRSFLAFCRRRFAADVPPLRISIPRTRFERFSLLRSGSRDCS